MTPAYTEKTTASELVELLAAEIKGKVILTTGPSPASIGARFVETIARAQPALIILASRNTAKLQKTADAIARIQAAEELKSWDDVPRIDVLVNNAGIMGTKFALSPDGFESQFATNHLGHFLFTNLIIDKLLVSEAPRVVSVSSDGHRLSPIRWADYHFQNGETYNRWTAYGQSKTANMLMALSLAEKLRSKGLLAYSLHPGVIITTSLSGSLDNMDEDFAALSELDRTLGNAEGWRDFKMKTDQQGAATTVYAAFDPGLKENNGAYLQDCRIADPWTDTVKPWGTSKVEAERLWKLSEKLVEQEFNY
ncbi:putative short-chain dehydrogenase [Aspergillus mulundensis]|uniref:Short-chain dehydrogenase n=1 Tax=Aspergillus mulundensis TaxID=1810919 RepID=A0A3D8S552_9EURO|nr:hypothetical protein DSM5745_04990 [Aspergillus mulundensis]RDW81433.1 hypothetical protein DSM5745_04990 [Aspergillus mulundensis]